LCKQADALLLLLAASLNAAGRPNVLVIAVDDLRDGVISQEAEMGLRLAAAQDESFFMRNPKTGAVVDREFYDHTDGPGENENRAAIERLSLKLAKVWPR
jgi:hypothetical protein